MVFEEYKQKIRNMSAFKFTYLIYLLNAKDWLLELNCLWNTFFDIYSYPLLHTDILGLYCKNNNNNEFKSYCIVHRVETWTMDNLFSIISVATGQRMVRGLILLITLIENILEFDRCKYKLHNTISMQCQISMHKTLRHLFLYSRHSFVILVLLISSVIVIHIYGYICIFCSRL